MGKLAERYGDAARSGVYRVGDAAIPRAAAREAGAVLVELGVEGLANAGWPQVEAAIATQGPRTCVLIVPDARALGASPPAGLLARLEGAARAARQSGRPFFAVLVAAPESLALPPLYHERLPQ